MRWISIFLQKKFSFSNYRNVLKHFRLHLLQFTREIDETDRERQTDRQSAERDREGHTETEERIPRNIAAQSNSDIEPHVEAYCVLAVAVDQLLLLFRRISCLERRNSCRGT